MCSEQKTCRYQKTVHRNNKRILHETTVRRPLPFLVQCTGHKENNMHLYVQLRISVHVQNRGKQQQMRTQQQNESSPFATSLRAYIKFCLIPCNTSQEPVRMRSCGNLSKTYSAKKSYHLQHSKWAHCYWESRHVSAATASVPQVIAHQLYCLPNELDFIFFIVVLLLTGKHENKGRCEAYHQWKEETARLSPVNQVTTKEPAPSLASCITL